MQRPFKRAELAVTAAAAGAGRTVSTALIVAVAAVALLVGALLATMMRT